MLYKISFAAQMEGIASMGLNINEGLDLLVKCTKCREERAGTVHLDPESWDDLGTNERTQANLVFSCKFCRCSQNITFVKESVKDYTNDMAPNASVMFHLECRGTEPIQVAMKEGMFWAKSESGTLFDAIGLPEWFEYDEKSKESISITDAKFTVA